MAVVGGVPQGGRRGPRRRRHLLGAQCAVRGGDGPLVGPAAVRARLWAFSFSPAARLLSDGVWWERRARSTHPHNLSLSLVAAAEAEGLQIQKTAGDRMQHAVGP